MAWTRIEQDGETLPLRQSTYRLERMKLPHGWLVRAYFELREKIPGGAGVTPDVDTSAGMSITFVPFSEKGYWSPNS